MFEFWFVIFLFIVFQFFTLSFSSCSQSTHSNEFSIIFICFIFFTRWNPFSSIDWTLSVEAVSQFIIINKYFSARAFSLWNLIQTELMKNLGPLYAARALKNPSEQLNILNCVLIFIFMTLMMYIHKSQYHKQFIQEIWLENLQKKWILFNSCNINRLFWISI